MVKSAAAWSSSSVIPQRHRTRDDADTQRQREHTQREADEHELQRFRA